MIQTSRRLLTIILGSLVGLIALLPEYQSGPESHNDPENNSANDQAINRTAPGKQAAIYDSNPNHIWNRLYRSLCLRTAKTGHQYGGDQLDPILWSETDHLLSGPSYEGAIKSLDEFLATNAERSITDPLKRALLQHDLWAVFDWSTQRHNNFAPQRRALQIRLAQAIRRLALSKKQLEELPRNYLDAVASKAFATRYDPTQPQTPFLPPDLFEPESSWVPLSVIGGEVAAASHVSEFFGRSVFLIFMRLPEGREATLSYLKKLADFPQPWIQDPRTPGRLLPNPSLPQFSAGTQLALVRQMMLIDNQGNLVPTKLTEQVQVRVHLTTMGTIREAVLVDSNKAREALSVIELKLSREKLISGKSGGLRAVAPDEKEFPLFQSHGVDLFQRAGENEAIENRMRPVLRSCSHCHFGPGIHAVLSRRRSLIASWSPDYEASSTVSWKHSQYDYGLLKGLWELQPANR